MNVNQAKNDVLVFKTNIASKDDLNYLLPVFQQLAGVVRWSVDTEDVDKVLRVECMDLSGSQIISALVTAGYHCEELL